MRSTPEMRLQSCSPSSVSSSDTLGTGDERPELNNGGDCVLRIESAAMAPRPPQPKERL